jgi:hypothetical protein
MNFIIKERLQKILAISSATNIRSEIARIGEIAIQAELALEEWERVCKEIVDGKRNNESVS